MKLSFHFSFATALFNWNCVEFAEHHRQLADLRKHQSGVLTTFTNSLTKTREGFEKTQNRLMNQGDRTITLLETIIGFMKTDRENGVYDCNRRQMYRQQLEPVLDRVKTNSDERELALNVLSLRYV